MKLKHPKRVTSKSLKSKKIKNNSFLSESSKSMKLKQQLCIDDTLKILHDIDMQHKGLSN